MYSENETQSLTMAELTPTLGSRCVVIGQTGCGKSTYESFALRRLSKGTAGIIIDTKGKFIPPFPCSLVTTPSTQLSRVTTPWLIWKPGVDCDIHNECNYLLDAAYYRGETILAIDDVYGLRRRYLYPERLEPVYTMGRQLGLTIMGLAQRPRHVPMYMLSEADSQLCFGLRLEEDRKRMAGIMGPIVAGPELPRHKFWFNDDIREIRPTEPLKLQLPGGIG